MLLLVLFGAAQAMAASPPRLLSDLDIPLMPGFVEEGDSRVVFDTPQGRIIEVRAMGQQDRQKTLDYYRLLLPSLGWRRIADKSADCGAFCLTARREAEILKLTVTEIKQPRHKTLIYFSVNPE
ncbi:MAG: hypothetical protein L3J50_06225 [Emcibacter sp.]|nr:hypothetical protein [Emcibacter sp.]